MELIISNCKAITALLGASEEIPEASTQSVSFHYIVLIFINLIMNFACMCMCLFTSWMLCFCLYSPLLFIRPASKICDICLSFTLS